MYKNIASLYLNITVLNTCEQIHSFKKKMKIATFLLSKEPLIMHENML